MKKVSSKSKARIVRLFSPPIQRTRIDFVAPLRLTVRRLIHHRRYSRLRVQATMAETVDGHILSLGNLIRLGYDYCG